MSHNIVLCGARENRTEILRMSPPLGTPHRSSSYLTMLNSFAEDLESILSDLSGSTSPLPTVHEDTPFLESEILGGQEPGTPTSPGIRRPSNLFTVESNVLPQSLAGSIASTSRSCSPETGSDHGNLSLLERLIRTHSIWFLPDLQRVGAVHLLENQDETGLFIVRQSSQPGTLALSIRLESDESGADVQHYLLETPRLDSGSTGVRLEASELIFDSLPVLFEHYSQCCDELPIQLRLPRLLREAKSRQALSAFAVLGQDFWTRRLAPMVSESPPKLSPRMARSKQPPPPPPRWAKPPQTVIMANLAPALPTLEVNGNEVSESELLQGEIITAPTLDSVTKDHAQEAEFESLPNVLLSAETDTTLTTSKEAQVQPGMDTLLPKAVKTDHGEEKATLVSHFSESRGKKKGRRRRQFARSPDGRPYRSSAADKASDYEDIWDSPPRELTSPASPPSPSSPTSSASPSSESDCEPLEMDPPAAMNKAVSIGALISFDDNTQVVSRAPSPPHMSPIDVLLDCHDTTNTTVQSDHTIRKRIEGEEDVIVQDLVAHTAGDSDEFDPDDGLVRPGKLDFHRASKRTSPLYSEPADALPKQRQPPYHASRPLPPFPAPMHFKIPAFHQPALPSNFTSYVAETPPLSLQTRPLPTSAPLPPERFVISNNNRRQTAVVNKKNQKNSFRLPLPLKSSGNSTLALVGSQKITSISWPVDSSWEFLHTDVSQSLVTTSPGVTGTNFSIKSHLSLAKPPHSPFPAPGVDLPEQYAFSNLTMRHVFAALRPNLALPVANFAPPPSPTPSVSHPHTLELRKSAYDNWASDHSRRIAEEDDEDDVGTETEFSEPWDSSRWAQLLNAKETTSNGTINRSPSNTATNSVVLDLGKGTLSDAGIGTMSDCATWNKSHVETRKRPPRVPLQRTKSFKDKMDPLIASPRLLALRGSERTEAGRRLRSAVLALGQDPSTTFCQNIRHFVQCTREAREARPSVVTRNVRQFMSGLKNFLLQHGEKLFDAALHDEQKRLKPTEFLNLGAILESCLQSLVLVPLHPHLYALFVQDALDKGKLQNMVLAMETVREMDPVALGLRADCELPSAELLDRVGQSLYLMQAAPCPLDKLEHLLAATTDIYYHATSAYGDNLSADEFLPLLAWACARCGLVTAEQEADFMWALLQPALLAGEGAYFLTALSSALQLLHGFRLPVSPPASPSDVVSEMGTWRSGRTPGSSPIPCVLRVLVADESQGSLLARTVPVRPCMTARDVSKLLSLKLRLSNPQDYGLVALIDGQETLLNESDSPHDLRTSVLSSGRNCTFAFRRLDAKIAWPSHLES